MIAQLLAIAAEESMVTGVQDWAVLLGGLGMLIWLVWRLFWKVDRRSQQELSTKDAEIIRLGKAVEDEKIQRYAAQEREHQLAAQVSGLRQNVEDLQATVQLLRQEIIGLRAQVGGHNAVTP